MDSKILDKILDHLGLSVTDIAIPKIGNSRPQILFTELISALIECDGTREGAEKLGLSKSALETHISRHLLKVLPTKPKTGKWSIALLGCIGYKRCTKCRNIDLAELVTSGKNNVCKSCVNAATAYYRENNKEKVSLSAKTYRDSNLDKVHAAEKSWRLKNPGYVSEKSAARRAALVQASNTDFGEETELIDFYSNRPEGYHVDHIVPLKHSLVCGLHVLANLQYLPANENLAKSNKFEIL